MTEPQTKSPRDLLVEKLAKLIMENDDTDCIYLAEQFLSDPQTLSLLEDLIIERPSAQAKVLEALKDNDEIGLIFDDNKLPWEFFKEAAARLREQAKKEG